MTKRKIIKEYVCGENHHNWKGDNVGYRALHEWVRRYLPKTKLCQLCMKRPPRDLANMGVYNREFKNWKWLCRSCHIRMDGRDHKGEKNGGAKLNNSKVIEIRKKYTLKDNYTKIGKKYGVSYWTISQIINRKIWTNI